MSQRAASVFALIALGVCAAAVLLGPALVSLSLTALF